MIILCAFFLTILAFFVWTYLSLPSNHSYVGVAEKKPSDLLSEYRLHIEKIVKKSRETNKAVDEAAKKVESWQKQLNTLTKSEARLLQRILMSQREGHSKKVIGNHSKKLTKVRTDLEHAKQELQKFQLAYNEILSLAECFEKEVISARKEVDSLELQLIHSTAEKHLSQSMTSLRDDLGFGKLADIRLKIQEEIDANNAAARVAQDLSGIDSDSEEDFDHER